MKYAFMVRGIEKHLHYKGDPFLGVHKAIRKRHRNEEAQQ